MEIVAISSPISITPLANVWEESYMIVTESFMILLIMIFYITCHRKPRQVSSTSTYREFGNKPPLSLMTETRIFLLIERHSLEC
ncbi:hypothetical protein A7A09_013880 [Paracoccus methylarcula]|uniref:Uncharacterized protein n=1 Tax=Paracoccus methylarcula TaxID=72022 RepID=A0A422QVJ6_9RHOB|nr:hypothetical protein A7A09_013880 [Paracoccus methylarcula]